MSLGDGGNKHQAHGKMVHWWKGTIFLAPHKLAHRIDDKERFVEQGLGSLTR
ncbi:hypothetical protein HVE01_06960 [Vreelandella venusta]|nr:hypothetical protein HVE01_06960 [Halomonas venusta]